MTSFGVVAIGDIRRVFAVRNHCWRQRATPAARLSTQCHSEPVMGDVLRMLLVRRAARALNRHAPPPAL